MPSPVAPFTVLPVMRMLLPFFTAIPRPIRLPLASPSRALVVGLVMVLPAITTSVAPSKTMAPSPFTEPVKVLLRMLTLLVLRLVIVALVKSKPSIALLLATVRVPLLMVGMRLALPAP